MNSADKCKANGWEPGTLLVGDEGYGPTVILVTAIGESGILARMISHNGVTVEADESFWTLNFRDWKRFCLQSPADPAFRHPHDGCGYLEE